MLFKYLPPERVDIILNQEIRFSQPSSLNDPFEKMKLIDTSVLKAQVIEQSIKDAEEFEAMHPDMTGAELEEFDRVKRQCLQDVDSQMSPRSLGDELMKLVDPFIGILSLSRTNAATLMWSHYAAAYCGFVIGCDDHHPFFSAPNLDGTPSAPKIVQYSSNRVLVNKDADDWYEKLFCQKGLEWAYEEEVRCFRFFSNYESKGTDNYGNPIYLCEFAAEVIKAIYVGYKASPVTREKILGFAREQSHLVQVFEAAPYSEEYRVKFKLLFPS